MLNKDFLLKRKQNARKIFRSIKAFRYGKANFYHLGLIWFISFTGVIYVIQNNHAQLVLKNIQNMGGEFTHSHLTLRVILWNRNPVIAWQEKWCVVIDILQKNKRKRNVYNKMSNRFMDGFPCFANQFTGISHIRYSE